MADAADAGLADAASDSDASAPPTSDAAVDPLPGEIDARFAGGFVWKVLALPGPHPWLVIQEPTQSIQLDSGHPRRSLLWLDAAGQVVHSFSHPEGYALLDACTHPSGEVSVLLASAAGYTLLRLDTSHAVRASQLLVDDQIDTDLPLLHPDAPRGPIGPHTHDTGRIAAFGESVVLAARNRRFSVVAYRYAWQPESETFERNWRVLVEPAVELWPVGLTGGTYDTFRQVESQFSVHLAVDPQGLAYVGINHPRFADGTLEELHQALFGESFANDPDFLDAYVTRISASGVRLGTSLVSTPQDDSLYGLRADATGAFALGRNETWNEQGTGHDALIARIDRETGAVGVRILDVQRGDIAFDAVGLEDGRVVVVGASNYDQNPHGASISETCDAFAQVLSAVGSEPLDLGEPGLPNGPRHSEARVIFRTPAGALWIGGMLDGPGTHSADADPSLLRASGFLSGGRAPR
jgi:hypothetical protein